MRLIYECDKCHTMIVIHAGDLSRIPFNRMPQLVLEAEKHRCNKRGK